MCADWWNAPALAQRADAINPRNGLTNKREEV